MSSDPSTQTPEELISKIEHDEVLAALNAAYMQRVNTLRAQVTAEREAAATSEARAADLELRIVSSEETIADLRAALAERAAREERHDELLDAATAELVALRGRSDEVAAERERANGALRLAVSEREDFGAMVLETCLPAIERHGVKDSPTDPAQALRLLAALGDVQRTAPAQALERELAATRQMLEAAEAEINRLRSSI